MQMRMPVMGGDMAHHSKHRFMKKNPMLMCFVLIHTLFHMAAMVCFLGAMNRGASALKVQSRLKALKAIPEAFTEEERLQLIEKVKSSALGCN